MHLGLSRYVHENLYGEQGRHPRTCWVLPIRLLTPLPPSLHHGLTDPASPSSHLQPRHCPLPWDWGQCHHPQSQVMSSKLPGPCSSHGLSSLWPLSWPTSHPFPTLVSHRTQGQLSAKSSVSSVLNVLSPSYSDWSLAVPRGPLGPCRPLKWWSCSVSADITLVARKGRSRENQNKKNSFFFLWLPGLLLNPTVWNLSFLAGEIKCHK